MKAILATVLILLASFGRTEAFAGDCNADPESGLRLFAIDPLAIVFPDFAPRGGSTEVAFEIAASPGETRLISMGISKAGPAVMKLNALAPPEISIETQQVEYGPWTGKRYYPEPHKGAMTVPLYLADFSELRIGKANFRQLQSTVTVSADAEPGEYEACLHIMDGSDRLGAIRIAIDVLPIKLADANAYALGLYAWAGRGRDAQWYEDAWRDMSAVGLTTLAVMVDFDEAITLRGGRPAIQWGRAEGHFRSAMNAYRPSGFGHPRVLWMMSGGDGGKLYRWCQANSSPRLRFATCYESLIEQIQVYGAANGWPEIVYQPVDEPFRKEDRWQIARQVYPIIGAMPGVAVEINGIERVNLNDRRIMELYPYGDVLTFGKGPPVLSEAGLIPDAAFYRRLASDGKEKWLYNVDNTSWHPEAMRFWYGYGLWLSRYTGLLQWSYQISLAKAARGDPESFYGHKDGYAFRYPASRDHRGGRSLSMEAIREGINDLRYLITLDRAHRRHAKAGGRCGAAIKASRARLTDWFGGVTFADSLIPHPVKGVLKRTPVPAGMVKGFGAATRLIKMNNGLELADYDRIRGAIADELTGIESSCVEAGPAGAIDAVDIIR